MPKSVESGGPAADRAEALITLHGEELVPDLATPLRSDLMRIPGDEATFRITSVCEH